MFKSFSKFDEILSVTEFVREQIRIYRKTLPEINICIQDTGCGAGGSGNDGSSTIMEVTVIAMVTIVVVIKVPV